MARDDAAARPPLQHVRVIHPLQRRRRRRLGVRCRRRRRPRGDRQVLAAIAGLRSPRLAARLPLGGLGIALAYFAVAVAVEVHTLSREFGGGFTGHSRVPHSDWTYGFYLGLACAGVAALSGLTVRRSEPLRLRGGADAVAVVLGVGLLVSFLLPWVGLGGPEQALPSVHGIENPAAAIAVLSLLLGAGWLHDEAGRRWRLALAIATAILTGAAASAVGISGEHLYGTWIGVGCAVSLVVVEGVRARPARFPVLPCGFAAVRAGAAGLLIVALFLPWEEIHAAGVSRHGTDGWYAATGTAAGRPLLGAPCDPGASGARDVCSRPRRRCRHLRLGDGNRVPREHVHLPGGYGSFVGFAAAGILLVTALVPLRSGRVDRRRALVRALPLAASVLCIAALVVSLWFVLPETWTFQATALYGTLAVAGVLLGLYLVRLWALRVGGPPRTDHRLTLVPLILPALASLELIRFRNGVVVWAR